MDFKGLLPIGTVILTKGAEKKLMIISLKPFEIESGIKHDYLAVLYPEGYIGESAMYFVEHSDIDEVFHLGYDDEEREALIDNLQRTFEDE